MSQILSNLHSHTHLGGGTLGTTIRLSRTKQSPAIDTIREHHAFCYKYKRMVYTRKFSETEEVIPLLTSVFAWIPCTGVSADIIVCLVTWVNCSWNLYIIYKRHECHSSACLPVRCADPYRDTTTSWTRKQCTLATQLKKINKYCSQNITEKDYFTK